MSVSVVVGWGGRGEGLGIYKPCPSSSWPDSLDCQQILEYCRLNLEEGIFYEPLASKSPGINKLAISSVHGLVGAAGEEGLLECFDMRQEQCAGQFDASVLMGCVSQFHTKPFTASGHKD